MGSSWQARVLVVEDDPTVRRLLARVLGEEYSVTSAVDGGEGWEQALEVRPDLILTDVRMPGMSGEELLKRIRSQPELQTVPVVILTGQGDDALRVQMLESGAQDYLTKPVDPAELRARVRNLVQMKRAGDLLRRRTAELEAANEELDAFCYSVSHDLRAPLRILDRFAGFAQEGCETLPDETRRCLRIVQESAQQMERLIDNLLCFSQTSRQPLEKTDTSPAEIARRVWSGLAAERDGRAVEFHLGDLPCCRADPNLLERVYVNLLSNALKFSRERRPAVIEVGAKESVYFVRDNGVGFDMQSAEGLFGVFQRLHSADEYEGTGAGLALVRRIIHRHGGQVWAEAEPGGGATFSFTI